jgi:predicted O-methyltransferase YrrM
MRQGALEKIRTLSGKALALAGSSGHFPDRLSIKAGVWRNRFSAPSGALDRIGTPDELERLLSQAVGSPARASAETDEEIQRLERSLAQRKHDLDAGARPFNLAHNGTATLGRLCYLVCRTLCPCIVVETGVGYGVTSTYVLHALLANERGELVSVDLPPLGLHSTDYVGFLVPQNLRSRWRLSLGSARRVLPGVLRKIGPPDVFIHDSLHTYSHMKWEFDLVLQALRPGGVIIADDIEGNRAFEEAIRHPSVESWFAIEQEGKSSICGFIRKKRE